MNLTIAAIAIVTVLGVSGRFLLFPFTVTDRLEWSQEDIEQQFEDSIPLTTELLLLDANQLKVIANMRRTPFELTVEENTMRVSFRFEGEANANGFNVGNLTARVILILENIRLTEDWRLEFDDYNIVEIPSLKVLNGVIEISDKTPIERVLNKQIERAVDELHSINMKNYFSRKWPQSPIFPKRYGLRPLEIKLDDRGLTSGEEGAFGLDFEATLKLTRHNSKDGYFPDLPPIQAIE